MRVFVTGATGFVGSAVVRDLLDAGHKVLGLARSDASAQALTAVGAQVHRGDVEDLASLRTGVAQADGVIHTAFNHDFSRFLQNCENDRRAIEALGDALAGSDRPLVITSGVGIGGRGPGELADEDHFDAAHPNPRIASELGGQAVSARGINLSVVRLPQVHDRERQGLVTYLITTARDKGVSAYVGDGANRLAAVHRLDAAPVYRLALEKAMPGARYNAVAEEGVSARAIAEAIGRRLQMPVAALSAADAPAHFGWLAMFVSLDMMASSTLTRQRLGWRPVQTVGLVEDIEQANAFE